MPIRKIEFTNNEYYHVFNRGVDKRKIFVNPEDLSRFFQSMSEFNDINSIGSIFKNSFRQNKLLRCPAPQDPQEKEKLVNFVCYCLNPNHYHFILEQLVDKGIEKFMHKIGGYSKYFNIKYERSGALFQGKFKAVHIKSNGQLLHTSAYVNLNNRVHSYGSKPIKMSVSSWDEYIGKSSNNFCNKSIILEQFNSPAKYKKFANESLKNIRKNKELKKVLLD